MADSIFDGDDHPVGGKYKRRCTMTKYKHRDDAEPTVPPPGERPPDPPDGAELPKATTWHGWVWLDRRWRRVALAESLESCLRLLALEARRLGVPNHLSVLMGGPSPPSSRPIPLPSHRTAPRPRKARG
jgi:hypothetical protein